MKITHYVYLTVALTIGAFLSLSGVALAAEVVDPVDGGTDLAKSIYQAFAGGHYAYAGAIALVIAVGLVRKYINRPWMHTDAGSASLVLTGSFGTALVASLTGGGALTAHLAWSAFAIAFAAAGGFAMVKKLIVEPLAPRLPAWLVAGLDLVFALAPTAAPGPAQAPGNTTPAPSVP